MSDQEVLGGAEGRPFAVADSIYCCWDVDHTTRTLEFLDGIDPDYFATVANILSQHIDAEDAMARSVALRVLYHQGVETLMSLLGAAVQGFSVVPAWIAKCTTGDLKTVAHRLQSGAPLLTEHGPQQLTFDDLATYLHRFVWVDEAPVGSTASQFGRFWHRLAGELLDDTSRSEYNALKHGTRVRPGGFSMSVGIEDTFGVPPAAEEMRSLGGSDFGSTFYVAEPLGSAKWHVRTRRTAVNWLPEPLAHRLGLISMSISNIVSALRCDLGVDPTTVTFARPIRMEIFDDVWKLTPGVLSSAVDFSIVITPEDELSRSELRDLLDRRTPDGAARPAD